jgi:hypothetical protein
MSCSTDAGVSWNFDLLLVVPQKVRQEEEKGPSPGIETPRSSLQT